MFTQLAEDDLLPTHTTTLLAAVARELPRVAASKLTLPHARPAAVKSEYYAIVRDCTLKSQPLLLLPEVKQLQLPPSSGVKLPRIEAMAECRQAGAVVAAAAAGAAGAATPLP